MKIGAACQLQISHLLILKQILLLFLVCVVLHIMPACGGLNVLLTAIFRIISNFIEMNKKKKINISIFKQQVHHFGDVQ